MPEDKLFTLVHSLSPSEKRYFRLFSRQQGKDAKYLELFDSLLGMESFDPKAFKKAHADIRQLSTAKSFLFDNILKAMRLYRSGNSARARIKGLMTDGIFLFEKNMEAEAERHFQKADELAEVYEEYPTRLEVLVWQRRLLKHASDKKRKQRLEEQIAKKEELLGQIDRYFQAYDQHDRLYMALQEKGFAGLGEEEKEVFAWEKEEREADFHTQRLWMQAAMAYYLRIQEEEQANVWVLRLLDLWEQRPDMQKEFVAQYRYIVANRLHFLARGERWEEIPPLLERMASLPVGSPYEEGQNQQVIYLYEQVLALNQGDLGQAPQLARKVSKWLDSQPHGLLPQSRISLLFNNLSIFFVNELWIEANRTLVNLQGSGTQSFRQDLLQASQIIELILLHERGEVHQLDLRYRALNRSLRKQGPTGDLPRYFLTRLRKVFNRSLWEEEADLIGEVRQVLEQNPDLYPGRGRKEFALWLRARQARVPMYSLV